MQRNEAVQKLSKVARISVAYAEDLYDSFFPKPVVKQFVADWYEANKIGFGINVIEFINGVQLDIDDEELTEFEEWLLARNSDSIQTLVNMHQFGYEVEKETKYKIKMKAAHYNGFSQFLCEEDRGIFWAAIFDCRKTKFTRKELEDADFGWVFDCPAVEVKEVK